MRRREFVTGIVGSAAAWPLVARAEQGMPVIGFLDRGTSAGMEKNLAGFRTGLAGAGYIVGKNVAVEYRWAENQNDRLYALAAELARLNVSVIAATRTSAPALAAKKATSTIPIVFQTGSDPMRDGLVASFNRPAGNVTGATRLTTQLMPKRIGVMLDLIPNASKIGLLLNPDSIQAAEQIEEIRTATGARNLGFVLGEARSDAELDAAFAALMHAGAAAVIEGSDPVFIGAAQHIVALTMRYKVPTIFFEDEPVRGGGLMSYAASLSDSFRQVGSYVGRILRGDKPSDLPVLQPTKFELVINLRAASALGLMIPPGILAIADEVIE
jgi:putative ABC transport system substrate-binding protein